MKTMDWLKNFFFFVMCASGLVATSYSSDGSYPDLETAQRFEICVVGGLSRSVLFSDEEKSQMSKILKESGTRMQSMGADPSNVYNARTMLRLFSADVANLVHKFDNITTRVERKQNYTSILETCSESLPKTAGKELTDEVRKILYFMENKKSHKTDTSEGKKENSLYKQEEPPVSDDHPKKRDKRSPQYNAGFQSKPPLDAVITGVLITTPSFGRTFKDGLSKQDALYYSRTIVEAGLAKNGYYNVINEALNEVTRAMSNLIYMPQTYDYASAIGNSINTVLSRRNIANFANGVSIGNAMISKLEDITPKPNSDVSFPSSFDSVSSSSAWDSGNKKSPPFQLNPSWNSPPAPAFEIDSLPKVFEPKPFSDSNDRFPLNPSFEPNPVDPLPTFDFGSPNFPDFLSTSANIPFQAPRPAKLDYSINPESVSDPFPFEQFDQGSLPFLNQQTSAQREISNPFGFDGTGSQDFSFTPFLKQEFPQSIKILNQDSFQTPQKNLQLFQEPQINQQTFQTPNINLQTFQAPQINQPKSDSYDLDIPQKPKTNTDTFIQPSYLQESVGPNVKDDPFSFDQNPILPENTEQLFNPSTEINPARPDLVTETISSSQVALETPDPYVSDVTIMIENTLGLSEDFSSNFDQNLSPSDAASIATAMTSLALSQYDPSIVTDVGFKIESAIYDLPTPSSTADYAHTIADTFIKAMQENGLLNSVNSKKMADSLIAGLKNEINRRKTLTDAQTMVQTSSLQTEMPIVLSDASFTANARSQAVAETVSNSDIPLTSASVAYPQEKVSSSAATSVSQAASNLDFKAPLTLGPSVSNVSSEKLGNESSNQNVPTTTVSPLDATEPMKLTTILNMLYTPFATTKATATKSPYMASLAEAAKNKDTLSKFLMEQINSTLKSLNATPVQQTTRIIEISPVTTGASVVAVNNAPSSTAVQEPETSSQATSITQLQDAQPEAETATESSTPDRYDEELTEFAVRVSNVATSTINYIRSGKVNTDELCGKLNILAFMVDIPPVDTCTELAMIDYLLNVMNAVIFTLRNR